MRTKEALFRGDTRKASLYADTALKLVTEVGSPLSLVFVQVAKAHVMHELGKHKEAFDYLSRATDIAYPAKNKLQIFYILLARSRFAFDDGKEASGISFLREAFAIGREEGIIDTFIDHPPTMSMLCARALEAGIEVEYVQEMIKKRKLTPGKPHLHLENWPWPLKVFTLGRFELINDGKPIQFQRKAQQRPLSMLKAMIAFGGKEVREDHIMDALWPEADGDMAQQSFATNLHRLRQLLSYEKAILRQEGKLTLDDKFCWVDLWAFEAILEQADGQWKKERVEKAIELTEKAIEMYEGPFLAKEIEQPWTISMRERLRSKFLRNVEKLGKYWQQSRQWEKALDCYLKGLEIDDLAEEFYSGLMTCYHRLGRKADVQAVYHRYKKTLSSLPGIEPSTKIKAIHRNLTKNI